MLTIRNLSASYNSRPVFQGIHLHADPGETVHITGENGSGKSTLCKIISGVKQPDTGSLMINGSLSFAAPCMIPYSSLYFNELISLTGITAKQAQQCNQLLRTMNVQCADSRLSELSSGNIQKLLLALALSRESEITVLDEPFTHLDNTTCTIVADYLLSLHTTLIVASHRHDLIHSSKRISLDASV